MPRVRAAWTVTAGLHQGHVIPELTKSWVYTSEHLAQDRAMPENEPTLFSQCDKDAHEYARSITNPSRMNYVKVEFLWP